MKKALFCFATLFSIGVSFSQNLNDGDILFTHLFSDPDKDIGFITLKDIPPNEEVYFTDNGLKSDGGFTTNEGILKWTSPTTKIVKGTIVQFFESSNQYTTSHGQIVKSGSFTLSASGEQLIAYQIKSNEHVYLAAINWGTKNSWITTGEPSTAQSYLPIGLNSVLSFGVHKDNGVYKCSNSPLTTYQLRESLLNVKNWVLDDEHDLERCTKVLIDDLVTIVEKVVEEDFTIYPNPVVENKLNFSKQLNHIKIYNLLGVLKYEVDSSDSLVLRDLEKGCYFLCCEEGIRFFEVQ
jgi:hypothetical protein